MTVYDASGEGVVRGVRVLTTTRRQIFLCNDALLQTMSMQTWLSLLAKHAPYIVDGKRQSDFCEHCHMWRTKIVPQFLAFVDQARADLETLYKPYFRAWDNSKRAQDAKNTPEEHAKLLDFFIFKHFDKNREAIREAFGGA